MAKIPTVKAVIINKDALVLKVTVPNTAKYKFKNLEQKIDIKQWDRKAGQCKKGHTKHEAINKEIFEERIRLVQAFEQDLANKLVFTEALIASRIKGDYLDSSKDFYAFCLEQIAIRNYKPETKRTYVSEVSKLQQYAPTLAFADLSYKWLQGYEHYCRNGLSNHPNTIWKTFKFLNTMCNYAIKIGGLLHESPFKNYKRGAYKQGIPPYVEWSEAQQIHNAVTKGEMYDSLRLLGYYGLLCYYGGLRFKDAVSFDYKKHVSEDTTGRRLVLYASKNGEIVSIAFNKYISEVVDYIKDRPVKISNQDFNDAMKTLAVKAGLSETKQLELSAHEFRHGFAMRCAELGMSIDDVQKLMGHSQKKSTMIYFRVKNARLDDAMKAWE